MPRYPGVTSALGCVMADMRHDGVQTLNTALDALDAADLLARIDGLAQACQERLDSAGVAFEGIRESIELDMLYVGQSHTVRVELSRAELDRAGIAAAFDRAYRASFGRSLDGIAVRILNLRYARIGQRPKFDLALLAPTCQDMPAALGTQAVFHAGQWHDAVRYARLDLPVGAEVAGPAILEQPDTTIWIEPGFAGRVDALGNLLITRQTA
ncbi:Acetone carboxylase beta subunit [compost metagenome]